MTLKQLMSQLLQVVTINKRHTSIKEFLKYIIFRVIKVTRLHYNK